MRQRIGQILNNFISNAVKFTEHGEIVVGLQLQPLGAGRTQATFSVKDTGIGIAPDQQQRIFHAFEQADNSTTRRFGGTGLGLAICRSLSEMLGGSIGLESAHGKGSTFWLSVPLVDAPAGERSTATERPNISGTRVAIIDDNPTNLSILSDMLSALGAEVAVFSDAEVMLDALRAAAPTHPFSAALLDMHMPRCSGSQLARRIREDAALRDMYLVLATSIDVQDLDSALFDSQLSKPILHTTAVPLHRENGHRSRQDARDHAHQPRAGQSPARAAARGRILVAEDNRTNQAVVTAMLAHLKLEADVVEDGIEALAALRTQALRPAAARRAYAAHGRL